MSLVGGSSARFFGSSTAGNKAYSLIGHGSADYGQFDQSSGTRMGDIFIDIGGEISTENGPEPETRSNYSRIGHGTLTANGISNSNVTIYADAWDISSASSVASGGVSVFEGNSIVAMLKNNLSGGEVIVGLRDSSLGLTSALNYDSPNDLTLFSVNNLVFDASVQNSNATGGDLNLVAGWDGVTAFDYSIFDGAELAGTALFGNDDGSIILGSTSGNLTAAVGSRSGTTRSYGYDLQAYQGARNQGGSRSTSGSHSLVFE